MTARIKFIQALLSINEAIFFYPKLRKFYRKHLSGTHVSIIDVGANKGQSILFFLKIYPTARIDAFEPNKKLYQLLLDKFKENPDIAIHNSGISNTSGKLLFYENVMDETSTFEVLDQDSAYLKKKAKILGVLPQNIIAANYDAAVIKLADFLEANQGIHIDVIKIDVEGHELKCLEGLFLYNGKIPVRYIQIESHNDDMYLTDTKDEVQELLKQNGFKEVCRIKHGFGHFYEIIFENEIKHNNSGI